MLWSTSRAYCSSACAAIVLGTLVHSLKFIPTSLLSSSIRFFLCEGQRENGCRTVSKQKRGLSPPRQQKPSELMSGQGMSTRLMRVGKAQTVYEEERRVPPNQNVSLIKISSTTTTDTFVTVAPNRKRFLGRKHKYFHTRSAPIISTISDSFRKIGRVKVCRDEDLQFVGLIGEV